MFTWKGVLDRPAYLWRAAVTIAFLIGTILLFPFLAWAIVWASHCERDTCGAVGLAVAFILRPIFFIVAMTMVLSVCIRRARDAGLHPGLGAVPPLMFAADHAFLQYAGAGWAYPFSAGILTFHPPVFALLGTASMALLAVPSRDSLRDIWNPLSVAPVAPAAPSPAAEVIQSPTDVLPSPAVAVFPEELRLWRPGRAALLGATVALAVMLWSLATNSSVSAPLVLIVLPAYLFPLFVPTFLLYTPLVAAVMRFVARRDAIGAAAVVAAFIPFGFWAASLWSVRTAKAQEAAAIAAIPKVPLPATVDAVVIEGNGTMTNCARTRVLSGDYGLGEVLTHGQSKKSLYLRFTRATAKAPVRKGIEVDTAPAEYIQIRFPNRPSFFADRVLVDIVFPPVEIYAVDAAGTQLVAASYTALNLPPAFPPMLTSEGWYRGDNSTTFEKSCKNVGAFIQRELLDKLPPRQS
jgi:uncharacterized membrane protein YhaH (DUF805 family)